jgi:dTDP-4-dehydrorhamnose reductase
MNILLLGSQGQVGWELQRALAPLGTVLACGHHRGAALQADLSAPATLAALVERVQPGLIVNAAAYTAVDRAESEPALAHAVNAEAPGELARCAAALSVPLVHYSTDYVFDGSGEHARREADATGPLNVYGRTKLAGEEAIRASGCTHLILRTSWVYAARGGNFARTMLRLAAEREALNVIDDQIGAPTGAELLADVTAHAVRRLRADAGTSGTYHCAAAGFTSWHGYARHAIEQARSRGQALKVAPDAVRAVPTTAYPTPAARPLNSRLDTRLLQQTFGLHLPPWQQGVDRMLAEVLGPA